MIQVVGNVVLLAVFAAILGIVVLRWPEAGVLLATAIVYLNLLPIALRYHHVPSVIVAVVAGLVVPALIKHWFLDRDGLIVDLPFLLMVAFLACITMSSLFSTNVGVSLPWIAGYITQGMFVYFLLINLV